MATARQQFSRMLGALVVLATTGTMGCGDDDRPASWEYIHAAIIAPNCTTSSCHTKKNAQAGVRLDDRIGAYTILTGHTCEGESVVGEVSRNFVDPGSPERSRLMYLLLGSEVRRAMPPDRPLPEPDIDLIEKWILEGARCN